MMSVKYTGPVWNCFEGGGSDLVTFLSLADSANDDGICWPSIAAIARKTRLSHRTAQRAVHKLIDAGYVIIVGNKNGGKPGSTRKYQINAERLTGVISDTGVSGNTGTGVTDDMDRGVVGVRGRVSLVTQTGVVDDTQTVSEPSVNRNKLVSASTPASRGSRLPSDWSLPDEYREWATTEGKLPANVVDDIADRFKDYWIAQPGQKGSKADWFATWRNWCRREHSTVVSKPRSLTDTRAQTIAELTGAMNTKESRHEYDITPQTLRLTS